MIDEGKLNKMTIEKLYTYYNILNCICEKYEHDLRPYYNPVTNSDIAKWNKIKGMLDSVDYYRIAVFEKLKEKTISSLNEQ